jgi:hypothetical protein
MCHQSGCILEAAFSMPSGLLTAKIGSEEVRRSGRNNQRKNRPDPLFPLF